MVDLLTLTCFWGTLRLLRQGSRVCVLSALQLEIECCNDTDGKRESIRACRI